MHSMFYNYSLLSNIDLSNFNSKNVTNMKGMFASCNNLKKEKLITQDMQILNQYDKSCIIF